MKSRILLQDMYQRSHIERDVGWILGYRLGRRRVPIRPRAGYRVGFGMRSGIRIGDRVGDRVRVWRDRLTFGNRFLARLFYGRVRPAVGYVRSIVHMITAPRLSKPDPALVSHLEDLHCEIVVYYQIAGDHFTDLTGVPAQRATSLFVVAMKPVISQVPKHISGFVLPGSPIVNYVRFNFHVFASPLKKEYAPFHYRRSIILPGYNEPTQSACRVRAGSGPHDIERC